MLLVSQEIVSPQEAYTLLATYKIKVVPSKFSVLTRYWEGDDTMSKTMEETIKKQLFCFPTYI